MKNLKRVLSLGLASVMLLGMMVVGASAKDFTDAEDIVHTEAVEVMVALKIINGMEDGSYFAPKDNVTRGQMAKMIAVMMNGGSEANTGVKGTPTFTDIGGHWAEGWIEYCADMKIIGGRGDGTFDPNGLVTGVEALKMVLTAMGYDAVAYQLQGAGWAAQTLENARKTGNMRLTEGLDDVVMTEPATRDIAAQMIWNGLQAYVVDITPDKNTNTGETTWSYKTQTGITLLNQRYHANIATGTFNGNYNYNPGSALKGEIRVDVDGKIEANKDFAGTHYFPSDLSIDNIGEEVKIVWKDGAKGTKNKADSKDTIYGVFNTGATRVVRSQLSKVGSGKNDKEQLTIDGTEYEALTDVTLVTNYNSGVDYPSKGKESSSHEAGKDDIGTLNLADMLKKNSGDLIKVVFDDATGKVSKVYLTETFVAAVTAINSENITLNNGFSQLKIADNDIAEDVKKGDIVLVTPLYAGDKKLTTVVKADKVSGEVTAFKDDESVTVDGKVYKLNYKNGTDKTRGLLQSHPDSEVNSKIIQMFNKDSEDDNNIGDDVELYLSNKYVVAAVQITESANNYSLVTEVKDSKATNSVFNSLQLQVMAADGTKEIITVSEDSKMADGTPAVESDDYQVGDIVTYTFNDDDEADVKIVAQAKEQAVTYDDKSKKVISSDGDSGVAAGDCVIFVQTKQDDKKDPLAPDEDKRIINNAEYKAYDIRALDGKEWKKTWATVAVNDKTDKVVAVFVNAGLVPDGANDDAVYAVISGYSGRVSGYYQYTAQANGEEYTLNTKDYLGKDKGILVKFNPTADDKYGTEKVTPITKSQKQFVDKGVKFAATDNYIEGYVNEFDTRDNTLSFFYGVDEDKSNGGSKGVDKEIYALDKDCKIVYVNQDKQTSLGEGSVDPFNNGAKKADVKANVSFIYKSEMKGEEEVRTIEVMFVETSGKQHVNYRLGEHK